MMGKDDMRSFPILNIWATHAEKKIGSYYGYKKSIEIIEISGCKATLPCGTLKVLGLLIGDHGTDCDLMFDRICNINTNSIDYTSLDTGIGITIISGNKELKSVARFEERGDGTIEFPFKPNSDKATVKVLRMHTDEDNFLKVQESHLLAIASYIKFMVAQQSRFGPDKMTLQDVAYFQNEWFLACRDAIANSSWPSESEQQELAGMINNPLSGNMFYVNR
jgi:hypothetical protein